MDSTLLQLFSAEEILRRLGEKESTGALHVFTAKESANLFFREGLIVGAVKGLVEGGEVVKQILDWKDARFIWQVDVAPVAPLAKPMEIAFPDLLFKLKAAPKLEIGGKTLSTPMPVVSAPPVEAALPSKFTSAVPLQPAGVAPVHFSISSQAATTGRMEPAAVPGTQRVAAGSPAPGARAPVLTATKNINPAMEAHAAHEEALLEKYRLVLIATGAQPERRIRLDRISSLVGRNPACDFTLDHPSVSRQHCLLQITDRGLHVKDLGTTNGTKVNGIEMTEGYINVDDKLTMGHLSFFLEWDEAVV